MAKIKLSGFVEEFYDDEVLARMFHQDGEEEEWTFPLEKFIESGFPEDKATPEFNRIIFYLTVDTEENTMQIELPPPWTQEELDEAKAKAEELYQALKNTYK